MRKSIVAATVLAATLLSPARATPGGTVAMLSSSGYTPSSPVVVQGADLLAANADPINTHTVTSVDTRPDGAPLFDSGNINQRQQTVVSLAGLAPGSYAFGCFFHYDMIGTLTIVRTGA